MEMYQEPPPVENPLEDPDSPMEDTPPLEPEPFIPHEPNVPGGNTHTLSPEESPVIPRQEYLAQDSPIKEIPPLPLEPTQYLNTKDGTVHLANKQPPLRVWTEYHDSPPSPVSHKHSLSPTSLSSASRRQHTSREGSYHSITPTTLSPIVSTSPQNQGNQTGSSEGSADTSSPTQSSADDTDNDMTLNWVSINMDYRKR